MTRLSPALFAKYEKSDIMVYCLLSCIFILRMMYIGSMGLVADEAYYWDWSRELALGYFDHPPMVAWLIFISTKLFGNNPFGVKFVAIACAFVSSLFTYRIAKKYVRRFFPLFCFIVLSNTVILFGIGSLLTTPDAALVACWSIGLFAAYAMIFEGARNSWLVLGIAMGLGMLSKYSFLLFILSFFIFLICSKEHRPLLAKGRFWAAMAIAGLIFLPNILWNSQHQWVSLLFQFRHGVGAAPSLRFDFLGDYIGGQVGVLSIFPFILLIAAAINELRQRRRDARRLFLLLFFAIPFLAFALSSLQKRVEPNWPCIAYISGFLLVPLLLESATLSWKRALKQFTVFSMIVSCLATALILIHVKKPFLPLPMQMDPTVQIHGWKQWGEEIQAIRRSVDPSVSLPICANSYQDAAFLAFYLPDHPKTLALNIHSRPNQYSQTQKQKVPVSSKMLFTTQLSDSCTLHPIIAEHLDILSRAGIAVVHPSAGQLKRYGVFIAQLRDVP